MIISKNYEALRERARLLGDVFSLLLQREALIEQRYSSSQPRGPAGQPNGGQWASEGGGDGSGEAGDEAEVLLAGGINEADKNLTVQQYVSSNCRAGIYEVLPGEFLGMSISEVEKIAKSGNAKARRCLKLLDRDQYRK
ncbi:MAG: hypothetical protein ACRCWO_04415 [Bosea sp. (in: a-proteobacteria)]